MPEAGDETRAALRVAVGQPRQPVDPAAVLERARVLIRRRTALRVIAAVALAVPVVAVGALLLDRPEVGFGPADGPLPASLEASEAPPPRLADGSEATHPPAAVTNRFSEPVVATERREALPESAGCTRSPLVGEGPARDRTGISDHLRSLIEATAPVVTHVGPVLGTSLATAEAPAPPGYPDAYATTCTAQVVDGAWGSTGLHMTHLYDGWSGFMRGEADGTTWPLMGVVSLAQVPEEAAWAVQEQPGWWLSYDVQGIGWMLVHSTHPDNARQSAATFPGYRVVFLDAEGVVVSETRRGNGVMTDDDPIFQPQSVDTHIRLGSAEEVRASAAELPFPACADRVTVCVWISVDGDELFALSAAGLTPDEVPPFGHIGWCASSGRFQGSATSTLFDRGGRYIGGPSPRGLNRYAVEVQDGSVVVDLSSFEFGPDRHTTDSTEGPRGPACDQVPDPFAGGAGEG